MTIDATKAENHCTILCIAPNPLREGEIWVGTDDGRIQHTTDGGATWTDHAESIKRFPQGAWIPQIHVSPHDADEVYVVVNDYRRNNWQPYLYRTTDGGESWVRLVLEGGEVTGHVLSVVQDQRWPRCCSWERRKGSSSASTGARIGNVGNTMCLRSRCVTWSSIHGIGDLVLGTFGRAAYVIDDLAPLRSLAAEGNGLMEESLRVFAIPDAYQVNFRRHAGARFPADHYWSGANYGGGVRVQFYVHPDTAGAYGEDDLEWSILNATGDTLRNGVITADGGIQTMRWRFDTNGMDWPQRELKKKKDEPSGADRMYCPGRTPWP